MNCKGLGLSLLGLRVASLRFGGEIDRILQFSVYQVWVIYGLRSGFQVCSGFEVAAL